MNEKNDFALVPRPPSAIQKVEARAKRILSGMVAETLALAKTGPSSSRKPLRKTHPAAPQFICELEDFTLRFRLQARSERDQRVWHWTGWDWQRDSGDSQERDKYEIPDDPRLEAVVRWLGRLDLFSPMPGIWLGDSNETFLNNLATHWPSRPEHAEFLADAGFYHLWQTANLDVTGLEQLINEDAKSWRQVFAEAAERLRKTAEQGVAGAQRELGVVAQDHAEAAKWFRKAAEQGDAQAQRLLGDCYLEGRGVAQDQAKAVEWYRRAAEQGDASAQCHLGWGYQNGIGVQENYAEAVKWYRKAAEQGYASAQCNLGWHYENGFGVPQDYAEAIKWYREAVWHPSASYNLGLCYLHGKGVGTDKIEAFKWFRLAAEEGHKGASEELTLTGALLSPSQCHEAELRIREELERAGLSNDEIEQFIKAEPRVREFKANE